MKKFILAIILLVLLVGCTQQARSRNYGGTSTIELPKGEKLIEVTWKDQNSLWYLVEPMEPDYIPKEKEFIESSSWGLIEGKVVFIESK